MRRFRSLISLVLLLASAGLFAAQPALAQKGALDAYCARISDQDKFASDGVALGDAASILRQDRANFHRFGLADADDEGDATFAASAARQKIPALIEAGMMHDYTAADIVDGNPYVCVDIYRDHLNVFIAEQENVPPEGYFDAVDYPFIGTWDCEVAVMSFTADTYNNGSEDLPIAEIQEGSDGSYTLLFDDGYFISLSGFTDDEMGWLSGESGDSFSCTRLG